MISINLSSLSLGVDSFRVKETQYKLIPDVPCYILFTFLESFAVLIFVTIGRTNEADDDARRGYKARQALLDLN
jgi:hypothetical protein